MFGAHIAAGAGAVLHHHGLIQAGGHQPGQTAGDQVGRPARREGHHQHDGAGLGQGRRCQAGQQQGAARDHAWLPGSGSRAASSQGASAARGSRAPRRWRSTSHARVARSGKVADSACRAAALVR